MAGRLNKNLINFFYVRSLVFESLCGQEPEPEPEPEPKTQKPGSQCLGKRWQEARIKWAVTCFVRGT